MGARLEVADARGLYTRNKPGPSQGVCNQKRYQPGHNRGIGYN
jgi:hypothetical protein